MLKKSTSDRYYIVLIRTFFNVGGIRFFQMTRMYPSALSDAQVEHRRMIDGIKNRDGELMMQAGRDHFNISKYMD